MIGLQNSPRAHREAHMYMGSGAVLQSYHSDDKTYPYSIMFWWISVGCD
jgi:hypothetical protein